jgi:phospholipid transport system substrate-binding protein
MVMLMKTFHSAFGIVVGVGVFVSCARGWAAESPLETIRVTVNQVVAVLQDPALQGAERRQARLAQMRAIVLPLFDAEELARRSLGVHWRDRTADEQKEFTALFTDLVEQSYSGTLDRYAAEVQVFYDREQVEGNFAEVNTRVFDPAQNRTFAIDYRLHRSAGGWLIYDVVIENVSMVRNYRNQFARILSRASYADLIQAIKGRLHQST